MTFSLQTLPELESHVLEDKLEKRILDCWADQSSTPLDLAVLLRQWMRREDIHREGAVVNHLVAKSVANRVGDCTQFVGISTQQDQHGNTVWSVRSWAPDWVRGASEEHPVDFCAGEVQCRTVGEIPADQRFQRLGYKTFKTNGQFAAVLAVRAMAEGSTTIVMLPTGSGKTEVALSLVEDLDMKLGYAPQEIVTVIVVPYVVLAKDFERRLQDLYKNRMMDNAKLPRFAYTHDMSDDQKSSVLERIESGDDDIPGIIVTSPESLVGKLREQMLGFAKRGRLGAIVVDEAHLLYQSGVDFRLDFREVAKFRNDSCEVAPPGKRPRTILMSATIGETELRHFGETFGPLHDLGVIDAISARDEPEIFIGNRCSAEIRYVRLREALARLPRPALVYVTKPEHARQLLEMTKEWGYGRTRCVVAETPGSERSSILRDLRTDSGGSQIDIVVANSAFGLGIDCDEIRTVIHVCLPETIDRWYQEIGRGGRDGKRSVGLLLPDLNKSDAGCDYRIASSLSPTTLELATFKNRWESLVNTQLPSSGLYKKKGRVYLDLRTKNGAKFRPPPKNQDNRNFSYDISWNRTVLFALQEFGLISLAVPDDGDWLEIQQESSHWDWVRVEFKDNVEFNDDFQVWWNYYRERTHAPFKKQLDLMWSVASGETPPCRAIEETYEFLDETIQMFKPSLQARRCAADCGHCSSCFERGHKPERVFDVFPKMSVSIEPTRIDLVYNLKSFWEQVPTRNSLTSDRTQILPAFIGGIELERLISLLRIYVEKNTGWLYQDVAITPDQIWRNQFFPQVPMWAVTTFRDSGRYVSMNRSILYRSDMKVPPLVVLLDDDRQLQKFDKESAGLSANADLLHWKATTESIVRVAVGLDA